LPEKDKSKQLDKIKDDIDNTHDKGKINREQFEKLTDGISKRYREIFKNDIDSLDNLSGYDKKSQIIEIKIKLEDAYATGKINELHHNLLKEKISNLEK
jgi:hypothetical protein